jgi:carboxyl-terminal processing protease
MSRWNLAWLMGIPAVMLLVLTLCYSAPPRDQDKDYRLVRMIVDVLSEVDREFVRELSDEDREKLVEDMINGGLEKLDQYSGYLNKKELEQFEGQSEGKFGGVGIEIGVDRNTGALTVQGLIPNTPAYEAGLMSGDIIAKVDGVSTENMTIGNAISKIKGRPGTQVTLTILRPSQPEPRDYTLTRAKIEIQAIMSDTRDPEDASRWQFMIDPVSKIAYIRLVAFNEHAVADMQKAILEIQRQGARGLILDLRDNPGGLLRQAVEIADLFLLDGTIVSIYSRNGKEKEYRAQSAGTMLLPVANHPIVVLVNQYSASASEILAAALQDHGRAVVIGERTFGKGSVQNIFSLPRGERVPQAALKLTTARYVRPSGKNIHRLPEMKEADEWGVLPDPGFEIKLDEKERLQYILWRRHRDILTGKGSVPKAPPKEIEGFRDRVLERGLEHLREQLRRAAAPPAAPLLPQDWLRG